MALNIDEVTNYVNEHITKFHESRIESIKKLKLKQILKRKNPYLFKAKNIQNASELIKSILDAYLSSQEETIFGEFLEKLSIFICEKVYHGRKSSAVGIDLEFEKENIRYIVSIKSGPNWGNSSQIKKMSDNFRAAKKTLSTNTSRQNVVAVNGCCYGQEKITDKGEYLKLCGQSYWEFISGDPDLYIKIIEPIGYQARQKNEAFQLEYSRAINLFTEEFISDFCNNGLIDWQKLIEYNSKQTGGTR